MTDSAQGSAPADSPPETDDRTLTWWPIAGAAIIAAIVALVIFFVGAGEDNRNGSRIEDDGALSCPPASIGSAAKSEDKVPTTPSGIDGKKWLVPDTPARFVVVCKFAAAPQDAPRRGSDTQFEGRVLLDAGTTRAAVRQLHKVPKARDGLVCAQYVGPGKPSYLLGFTFDTGIVWVWVPGEHCSPATNGEFDTNEDLVPDVARAYSTKRWP